MTPTEHLHKNVAKNGKEGRIIACFHGHEDNSNWTFLVVFFERKDHDNSLSQEQFDSWVQKHPGHIAYDTLVVDSYLGFKYLWYYYNELEFTGATIPLEKILNNLEQEICSQKNI